MAYIDKSMSVSALQQYAKEFSTERGFDDETLEQKFILLVEEVGELAKAIRGITNVKFAEDTRRTEVEDEIADVQFLLLNIANKLEVELVEALKNKDVKNRKRTWK